jgi:hypothetical protein
MFQVNDGTTPVTTTSQDVAYWTDLSGKGRHAKVTFNSNKPTYQTVSGVGVVRFNSANNDEMLATGWGKDNDNGWTRVSVLRPRLISGFDHHIFSGDAQAAAWNACSLRANGSGYLFLEDTGGGFVGKDSDTLIPANTWAVVAEQWKSGAGNAKLQVNNNTLKSGTINGDDTIGTTFAGAYWTSSQDYDIAAVFEINRTLTTTELNNLRTYMGNLVGISL